MFAERERGSATKDSQGSDSIQVILEGERSRRAYVDRVCEEKRCGSFILHFYPHLTPLHHMKTDLYGFC